MKRTYTFLLLLIGATLLFEAEGPIDLDVWAKLGWYVHADISSWFPVHIVVSPLEVCVVIVALLWWGRGRKFAKPYAFQKGTLLTPILVFGGVLAFGVVNGLMQPGDNFTFALWEIRGFAMLIGVYMLVGCFIRKERDLNDLVWVILISAMGLAIENTLRAIVFPTEVSSSDLAYDHIDSMIIASATVLCIGLLAFGATHAQRRFAIIALPLFLISLEIMRRRAAFVVIAVGLVVLVLFLLRLRPRVFWKVVPAAALLLGVYLAAFWNNTSALGQPARAISSQFTPDQRDAASNIYRLIEKADILANIQTAPLTGLGFGQQFHFFFPLPDVGGAWPFWHYTTHNAVLWVWMKDGMGGFMVFLWLLGLAAYQGAKCVETQREEWTFVAKLRARLSSRHASERAWETVTMLPQVLLRPSAASKRQSARKQLSTRLSANSPTLPALLSNLRGESVTSDRVHAAAPSVPLRARSSAGALGLNVPGWERTDKLRSVTAQRSGAVALVVMGICMIPMQIAYSYVDLGLTSERGMLLFGLMLGVIARAPALLGIADRESRTKAQVPPSSAQAKATRLLLTGPMLSPEDARERVRTLVRSRNLSRPLASSVSQPLARSDATPLLSSEPHPASVSVTQSVSRPTMSTATAPSRTAAHAPRRAPQAPPAVSTVTETPAALVVSSAATALPLPGEPAAPPKRRRTRKTVNTNAVQAGDDVTLPDAALSTTVSEVLSATLPDSDGATIRATPLKRLRTRKATPVPAVETPVDVADREAIPSVRLRSEAPLPWERAGTHSTI